jgi:adenine deaminase
MQELLKWACVNGARFMRMDNELGRIVPGMKPGIVLVTDIDADGYITELSRSKRMI